MSSPAFPIDPESLLADSTWLRALARGLVRDSGAADDLAQEAWVTALRSERAQGVERRTWLAGVLRNVAWKRARSEARRGARELRGARTESLPATDELVLRAEMQKSLSEAVLALQEPFRTTILLRYLEELDNVEIARRLRVPEGTVRWRVMRGLELLRSDLEQRRGREWLHSCALLAGLASRPESAAVAAAAGAGVLSIQHAVLAASIAAAGTTAAIGGGWIEAPWDETENRTASGGGAPELTTTNPPSVEDAGPITSPVEDESGARATRSRIPLAVQTPPEASEESSTSSTVTARRTMRRASASPFDPSNFEIEAQSMLVYVASTDLEGADAVELDVNAMFTADGKEFLELSDAERGELLGRLATVTSSDSTSFMHTVEDQDAVWCSWLPHAGLPFGLPPIGTKERIAVRMVGSKKELSRVRVTTEPDADD